MQIYHGTISTGAENIIKNGIVLAKLILGKDFIPPHLILLLKVQQLIKQGKLMPIIPMPM